MLEPAAKLQLLTTSVFSDLAQKKAEKLTSGIDLIDLSIGSPDLAPPSFVREYLSEAVRQEHQYGYAISSTEEFKEAVCYFYKERYGVSLGPDEVLQLMGSQDGLAHIALAYLEKGDILIAPDPGYPIYSASAHIAGAEIYHVPLTEENEFMADLDKIPEEICKRAKVMIANYPGNPTSALATREYFQKLIEFGIEHQILIVHDFAYSELIFDNRERLSIFSIPEARTIAVEFNSLSKSFNMAGARIGYLIGAPALLKPLSVLKSHIDYGVFFPIQRAASIALTSDFTFLENHCMTYEQRRNTMVQALGDIGWNVRTPHGGMFIWAKIPEKYTSLQFSLEAMEQGVIVTPG